MNEKDINQMTKTALTRLQDEIDAVRKEAFSEGYAAAMRSIREFASRPLPAAAAREGSETTQASAADNYQHLPDRRPPRGANAKLIEGVLQSIAPRAARPSEIRNALRHQRGVALAFTSIRHALGQLEARRVAEQVANSKTWRYRGGSGKGTLG
jgi:hypothetical protein